MAKGRCRRSRITYLLCPEYSTSTEPRQMTTAVGTAFHVVGRLPGAYVVHRTKCCHVKQDIAIVSPTSSWQQSTPFMLRTFEVS